MSGKDSKQQRMAAPTAQAGASSASSDVPQAGSSAAEHPAPDSSLQASADASTRVMSSAFLRPKANVVRTLSGACCSCLPPLSALS